MNTVCAPTLRRIGDARSLACSKVSKPYVVHLQPAAYYVHAPREISLTQHLTTEALTYDVAFAQIG